MVRDRSPTSVRSSLPIPMRGNEPDAETAEGLGIQWSRLPIPMRGNEWFMRSGRGAGKTRYRSP